MVHLSIDPAESQTRRVDACRYANIFMKLYLRFPRHILDLVLN